MAARSGTSREGPDWGAVMAGAILAILALLAGAALVAATALAGWLPDAYAGPTTAGAALGAVFLGGMRAGRRAGTRGWLHGGLAGLLAFAAVSLPGLVFAAGAVAWGALAVRAALAAAVGAVAGTVGVNLD